MTPGERQGIIASLRKRLDATNPDWDNSPFWRLVATRVSAAIADAEAGRLADAKLNEIYRICKDYDAFNGRRGNAR